LPERQSNLDDKSGDEVRDRGRHLNKINAYANNNNIMMSYYGNANIFIGQENEIWIRNE